jgi:anhydro-N-acetylmuramic acid kinase
VTKVIGLISGTSVDGIDAALAEITGTELDLKVELLAASTFSYPADLRSRILDVCAGAAITMAELAELDDAIAEEFARAAMAINTGHPQAELIGSHGQTVYHRPPGDTASRPARLGYSLQLGRGAVIAELTGIPTVSNFRAADIALGGQGAPLVPKVDVCLLSHPTESRCVQNIGGIGNVAFIPATGTPDWERGVRGWDTGPGNVLLDIAVQQLTGGAQTYDKDGAMAATGSPCAPLVELWLQHPFFQQQPPKSTGRELFGVEYFHRCLAEAEGYSLSPADLLASLAELTAASIARELRTFLPVQPDRVLLCGGGSRNLYLKSRLQAMMEPVPVLTTSDVGLSADFKEAIDFGVLAYWRQLGITGNLPLVTGARQAALLGVIYFVLE